jgi:hypothetical protein
VVGLSSNLTVSMLVFRVLSKVLVLYKAISFSNVFSFYVKTSRTSSVDLNASTR